MRRWRPRRGLRACDDGGSERDCRLTRRLALRTRPTRVPRAAGSSATRGASANRSRTRSVRMRITRPRRSASARRSTRTVRRDCWLRCRRCLRTPPTVLAGERLSSLVRLYSLHCMYVSRTVADCVLLFQRHVAGEARAGGRRRSGRGVRGGRSGRRVRAGRTQTTGAAHVRDTSVAVHYIY